MASHKSQICVVGHSFISRLYHQIQDQIQTDFSPNFNIDSVDVVFVHGGGYTILDVQKRLADIVQIQPQVIIIQIGGNDISAFDQVSGEATGYNVLGLASDLRAQLPDSRVVILI